MKIFVVTNYSSQFLSRELQKHGHEVLITGFQELDALRFNEDLLNEALQCDCIVLHFTSAQLVNDKLNGGTVRFTVDRISEVLNVIKVRLASKPAIIVPMENVGYFPESFDNSDFSYTHAVSLLNSLFANLAESRSNIILSNISSNQHNVDLKTFISSGCPYNWTFYKSLAETLASPIRNFNGGRLKGIILDLDNTCWDGVIGDLGLSGVRCRLDDGGELHYLLQTFVVQAFEAGILIAISSKNEKKYVVEALQSEEIVLSEEIMTHIQANWEPKDLNIQKIISDWNISERDVLFLDDNPTERSLVRRSFNEMIIPDWDSLKELFVFLAEQNIILPREVTNEDKVRTKFFKAETERSLLSSESKSYEEFLRDLNLKMGVNLISRSTMARALQLFQKTNQFNTCQIRFSKNELEKRIEEQDYITLLFDVEDRYSNYGVVSAIAISIHDNELKIDNWVMSCRVFKKQIEIEILKVLADLAVKRQLRMICIPFNLTDRNGIVKNFLDTYMSFNTITKEYSVEPKELYNIKTEIECKQSNTNY